MINVPASEQAILAAVIDPDATAAGTVTSTWVNLADYGLLLATIFAGTLGASATVDAKLEQATDASGTSAKDITGKSITQLTQAGTDSDKQALINCNHHDLDVANDFDHVRLSITVAVATSDVGGCIHGVAPFGVPAAVSTVDETVT